MMLFLFLLFTPMDQARIHVRNEAWGEAVASLKGFKPNDDQRTEFNFLMAVSHCRLNHKAKAIDFAEKVADPLLHDVPRRYREVSELIIWEAEKWKTDAADLDDIHRDMKAVTDRLKNRQAGKDTQAKQKEILSRLDKLIKQKEDEANQAKAQVAAKQQQQKEKVKPLEDFQLPTGEKQKGEVNLKKMKEYADVWGKLPPKERTKAMTELTRSLPPRYRDAIEEYFKRLERTSSAGKKKHESND